MKLKIEKPEGKNTRIKHLRRGEAERKESFQEFCQVNMNFDVDFLTALQL